MSTEKLILMDGHSILSRAFYGIPELSNTGGVPTNAVYGFLNIMLKMLETEEASHLAVAFDLPGPTFRHKMFEGYKGTRKGMPEELLAQVPLMQELLKAMNVPILSREGYEADDILGTIAKRMQEEGKEVIVVSGDRDLLQLADSHITIALPKTRRGQTEIPRYTPEKVQEEWGVTPLEFIDEKALMGDSSDNIPGVPGMGEKTAEWIISRYHSIENAYAHRHDAGFRVPRKPKAGQILEENWKLAQLSKRLAAICIDAPIDFRFQDAEIGNLYNEASYRMIQELELKSLIRRFEEHLSEEQLGGSVSVNLEYKEVCEPYLAKVIFSDAGKQGEAGFYFSWEEAPAESSNPFPEERDTASETSGREENAVRDSAAGKAGQLPASKEYGGDRELVLYLALAEDRLYRIHGFPFRGLFEELSRKAALYTLDLKQQLSRFYLGREKKILDLSLMAYLIDPEKASYDAEDLSLSYLSSTLNLGKDSVLKNTARAAIAFLLRKKIPARLQELQETELYREIEHPLIYTLYDMETEGVMVDRAALRRYGDELLIGIEALRKRIYEKCGEEFNINSPKQLGEILFGKLGMPGGKKTKTGYSTAADVLEKLSEEYDVVRDILEFRTYSKLSSTYAEGLQSYIGGDERIHGKFHQMVTATGRISSSDPNLQNIPIRTEMGRRFRSVFVPKEGCIFLDADYSQVELRILASLSGDEQLISAYRHADDIHAVTASQVFHVPLEEVTPELRRNAKAVNFGIVYGISAFGLSEGLSISRAEARQYIERYFESYPKVKEFLDHQIAYAREHGFIRTYYQRIRPVPDIKASNFMRRSFSERVAMNSPIQGTAADIMKIAMNRVNEALREEKLSARIVLQVHDELLLEVPLEEEERVRALLLDKMEHAAELAVKLVADCERGKNWEEAH